MRKKGEFFASHEYGVMTIRMAIRDNDEAGIEIARINQAAFSGPFTPDSWDGYAWPFAIALARMINMDHGFDDQTK